MKIHGSPKSYCIGENMLITLLILGLVCVADGEAANQTSCRTVPVAEGETGNLEFIFKPQDIMTSTKLYAYVLRDNLDAIRCRREEEETEISCTIENITRYQSEGIVNGSLRLHIFNVSLKDAGTYKLLAYVNDTWKDPLKCELTVTTKKKDEQAEEEYTTTADLTEEQAKEEYTTTADLTEERAKEEYTTTADLTEERAKEGYTTTAGFSDEKAKNENATTAYLAEEQTEEENTQTAVIVTPIVILAVAAVVVIIAVLLYFKRKSRKGATDGDNTDAAGDHETLEHLLEGHNTAGAGGPAPVVLQAAYEPLLVGSKATAAVVVGNETTDITPGEQEKREHLQAGCKATGANESALEEESTTKQPTVESNTPADDVLWSPTAAVKKSGLIEKPRWYHTNMGKDEARHLLLQESSTDGSFLVYTPKECPTSNILSVKYEGHVFTFDIHHNGREFWIEEGKTFTPLQKLVDHYRQIKGCLPHTLGRPCVRQEPSSWKRPVNV